nr:MAG TPA: hypothetical protein [Caudoviricetes sp.]
MALSFLPKNERKNRKCTYIRLKMKIILHPVAIFPAN